MQIKKFFDILGPGMITGAADDDPSGIVTYCQAGAQFGYGLLWTAIFMLPLQIAIQEACARIATTTGHGLSAVVKKHYSRYLLFGIVFLIFTANTINIGADLAAMAAVTQLILPLNFSFLTIFFSLLILVLQIFIKYKNYTKILKWLCLFLLAYPLILFIIDAPWKTILESTFLPHFEFSFEFFFLVTAVLGTTISPYMFFWQGSQQIEEENSKKKISAKATLKNIRIDTVLGMLSSEIGAWSIIVVAATVYHANGILEIQTAADAAKALEPLVSSFPNAGYLAKLIFTGGILGLGFLAIPILAGSSAYALGEALNFKIGLDYTWREAKYFYATILVGTLLGLFINFTNISPMHALIYAAVINGLIAVPLIFMIGFIASDKKIMGKNQSGKLSKIFVKITFISMLISGLLLTYSLFF